MITDNTLAPKICDAPRCNGRKSLSYELCGSCLACLPESLQRAMKPLWGTEAKRISDIRRHSEDRRDAFALISLETQAERDAYTRLRALQGASWACEAMNRTRPDEWRQIISEQVAASKGETNV